MEKKKTFVEDIDRKAYDISNADEDSYRITSTLKPGFTKTCASTPVTVIF